ncbi:phosphatidate cytidylyltransferase [Thermatribacter velox]|uniref:Phosphatidate cytidylyltransferase n=1 Tax=Thermatribacter velox TaxID=3039681 RepID=A0ABZ2Y8G5_9BACT
MERNELRQRTLSIVITVPLFLILVLLNKWSFVFLFWTLSLLAMREFSRMVFTREERTFALTLFAVASFLVYGKVFWEAANINHLLLTGWYGLFIALICWSIGDLSRLLERLGLFLFGVLYCFLLPLSWVKVGIEWGRLTVIGFALVVWLNDIGAYLLGKRWGKHKIVPRLSPGKSWEGFWGGLICAALGAYLVGEFSLWPFSESASWWFGLALGSVAFLGDLLESGFKRRSNLKDSGFFLPGHGGVLDRFDSFFMVGPLAYLFCTIWR